MSRKTHIRAFTLIEMLVVVGIISVLMAIAVPSLSQMGIFGSDPVNAAARKTLTMLKAARINAGANRLDTAVVYQREYVPDSRGSSYPLTPTFTRAMMVRQLNSAEFETFSRYVAESSLVLSERDTKVLTRGKRIFVPLRNEEGQWETLAEEASILLTNNYGVPLVTDNDIARELGIVPVLVLKRDWEKAPLGTDPRELFLKPVRRTGADPVEYSADRAFVPGDLNDDPTARTTTTENGFFTELSWYRWPAHVFQPTGVLQDEPVFAGNATYIVKERYVLSVGPRPDASVKLRFLEEPDSNGNPQPAMPSMIEIYASTGRIQSQERAERMREDQNS